MAEAANPKLDEFLGGKVTPVWQRYAKWILLALVVIAVVFGLWRYFGSSAPTGYATQKVERGALTVTVSATGKLAPTNQVQVGSELSGLITKVLVDVNDRVTAGQTLALIDPSRLDDTIKQSEAAVAAAQATVAQNQAALTESRAQLARFDEVSRLSGGRVPAKTEMDNARAAVARAAATLRASQAQVVSQQAALRSDRTQRDKAIIRSPVNGVVLARQVEPGQTVASSFNTPTLFVIAEDLSAMELEVAIDEADVGQVKDGQKANFTVDAFPGETFPAAIRRVDVGSNLSAQSSTSTSTTTTSAQVVSYGATLSVSNAKQKLRPGMTATAEIVTLQKNNVLLVPNAAFRFTPSDASAPKAGGGMAGALVPRGGRRGQSGGTKSATIGRGATQTVYVKGADGQPQAVQVTTGDTNGQVTEILSGDLKEGMEVITGQYAGESKGSQRKSGSGQRRQGSGGATGG